MSSHPQLHQWRRHLKTLHRHPRSPVTPLEQQLRRPPLPLPLPKLPCPRSNPHRSPRAHQLQIQHRRAHPRRTTRPRLLHLFWTRLPPAPLPRPPHKVLPLSRNGLPLLLQMPPLPELDLLSTMAPAIPRFASFNSGRAGRSVAHVKTLSVRRRSQTEATAFTRCTAAGTAKGRRAVTALTSQLPLPLMKVGISPTGSGTLTGAPALGHPLGAHRRAGKKAGTKDGISDQSRFSPAVAYSRRINSLNRAGHRFLLCRRYRISGPLPRFWCKRRARFPDSVTASGHVLLAC